MEDLLPSIRADPNLAVDGNGDEITVGHLCGIGEWAKGQTAAELIPADALGLSAMAAAEEFFKVVSGTPAVPATDIRQGADESFDDFVLRVEAAVQYEDGDESFKSQMVRSIAASNCNPACKAAIQSLPLRPRPTLRDLLEVCARKVPILQRAGGSKAQSSRRVAAADSPEEFDIAATGGPKPAPARDAPCHLCAQIGHWMPECPLLQQFYKFRREMEAKQQKGGASGGNANAQKNM